MAWLDSLSDPAELRRCVRGLIAMSTLHTTWTGLLPQEICDRAVEALASTLDADLVYMLLPSLRGAAAIEVIRGRAIAVSGSPEKLKRSLIRWIDATPLPRSGQINNPYGKGHMRIAASPIGLGLNSMVVAGSAEANFPSPYQLLLLDFASVEVAIGLHRWQYELAQRSYQTRFGRSSDLVALADLDGRVLYINPAGSSLLGLAGTREAEGRDIMEFVAEADREQAMSIAWSTAREIGRWSGEIRLLHVTGERIPFSIEWFLIEDPRTGRAMSMATVSRDLRPQRRVEAELRTLNDTLEQRVLDGVAGLALANRKLKAAIAERRRADARVREVQLELFHALRLSATGQMAATLEHELSQPLSAASNLLGAALRLLADGGPEDKAEAIGGVEEALEQMARSGVIIQRLRHFIRDGKAPVNAQAPNLQREMNDKDFVIHVVDDNTAALRSLDRLLRANGFSTRFYDGPFSVLDNLPSLGAGCLLIDIQMKGMTGLELLARLRASGIRLPVVTMTGLGEISLAMPAMKLGAVEFLEKPFSAENLLSAIAAAKSLPSTLDLLATERAIAVARAAVSTLTFREKQVLIRLSEGKPQKVIAYELGISPRTVEVHRARMLRRLGTPYLAHAIRLAVLAELPG
ncbi:MAG TPA: response regulator [Devosiaceae bacterium]|nr:response regulator [Devosiaceae bacterium]